MPVRTLQKVEARLSRASLMDVAALTLAAPVASKAMEAAPSAAEAGEPRSGTMEAMELLASAVE